MAQRQSGKLLLRRAASLAQQLLQQQQHVTGCTAAAATQCRTFSSKPLWASPCPHGPPAFAFDIDGVLVRGKHVLPWALEAMKKLTTPGGQWRYPVVFMTNGGGVTEGRKAEQLSNWLGVPVAPEQVILAHTPMRDLVPELAQRPVLVSGRGDVLQVARSYGFQRVLHTRELAAALPTAAPFAKYPLQAAGTERGSSTPAVASAAPDASDTAGTAPFASPARAGAAPAPATHGSAAHPCPVRDLGLATEAAPIDTILVMTDPDDWYRDSQLLYDVLTGAGVPTRSPASAAAAGAPPVKLIFSNPDLLWANEFPRSRFGQGAFAHMLLSIYSRLTAGARPHHVTYYGKPNPQPYRLAERLLLSQAQQLGLHLPQVAPGELPFSGIYAVGDNPAADVRGANQAGGPWVSVLVRTGVFQGPGPNCDVDTARVAVDDVAAAVDAALHHTRNLRWHSMR
ncbi:hypothetical protein Agub_g13180 [Astrephomene gubernaculifera]|uniref:Uncharacterized protein n=1 Tax=Astrephomene gubernaculifera TaxID=47775 RepID=A0AAD3E1G2_9CHLO|nr:hypothetical protein Agub_g13180 [Astrephomene gubernaculifera]